MELFGLNAVINNYNNSCSNFKLLVFGEKNMSRIAGDTNIVFLEFMLRQAVGRLKGADYPAADICV